MLPCIVQMKPNMGTDLVSTRRRNLMMHAQTITTNTYPKKSPTTWPAEALSKLGHLYQREERRREGGVGGRKKKHDHGKFVAVAATS